VRTANDDQKHRLTTITGMAGLGLDAIASVAYGPEAIVLVLAVLSGALLVGTAGRVDVLVPLFAIGVFVGFALAQIGMVRHWRAERGRG
jgi:hypothetical protein